MADCVWHLKVVNSLGFFTRGEKGKIIQKACGFSKHLRLMQKIPRRVSLQSLHNEAEEIASPSEKGNFSVFLRKTFSLRCNEENSLWVLSRNRGRFLEASWRCCLSYSLSQEAKVKFCVCPLTSSCCVCGGESHLHTWFPLSQRSRQRSPQTDRQEAPGTSRCSPTFKRTYHTLWEWVDLPLLLKMVLIDTFNATGVQRLCRSTIKCSKIQTLKYWITVVH